MKVINLLSEKRIKDDLSYFKNGSGDGKDDGRKPWARYASFDYCFNYFQGFKNKKELSSKKNIQTSCLHLAFYLASWGMLRGSSFLLRKSIKFYEPLIKYISEKDNDFWRIDVADYSEPHIGELLKCAEDIKEKLSEGGKNKVSDTQTTKIMLGVFGCVPAFDEYFKKGSGLNKFNRHALRQIKIFYDTNNYARIVQKESNKIKTFEYNDEVKSKRPYTEAKIIDMLFFMEGYNKKLK